MSRHSLSGTGLLLSMRHVCTELGDHPLPYGTCSIWLHLKDLVLLLQLWPQMDQA